MCFTVLMKLKSICVWKKWSFMIIVNCVSTRTYMLMCCGTYHSNSIISTLNLTHTVNIYNSVENIFTSFLIYIYVILCGNYSMWLAVLYNSLNKKYLNCEINKRELMWYIHSGIKGTTKKIYISKNVSYR